MIYVRSTYVKRLVAFIPKQSCRKSGTQRDFSARYNTEIRSAPCRLHFRHGKTLAITLSKCRSKNRRSEAGAVVKSSSRQPEIPAYPYWGFMRFGQSGFGAIYEYDEFYSEEVNDFGL